MNLSILDGRTELWQWDTGIRLAMDEACEAVNISASTFGVSVDVTAAEDGKTWVATVPDEMLQVPGDLICYAVQSTEKGAITAAYRSFRVNRRPKPYGYVATPTEARTWQELDDKKIDAPQVAQAGEVLTVEEVDEDGKPKKWKTAPAAAEQKQADWMQNDETAADYVKNRPFYTEILEKTFESSADNDYTEFPDGISFEVGDDVEITVDGERLTLVAKLREYYVYIGDSFTELSAGTGQYGWIYYYDKIRKCYGISSKENHVFGYREKKYHRLDMEYSPVKLMSENAGVEFIIERLYISENIYSKGLELYYDEAKERYTLAAYDNNMSCSTTLYIPGNKNITDVLSQEEEFGVSGYDIKSICENDLLNFQYYRILICGFVLNDRGYYVVISTTDDSQYTSDSLAGTKHYIGTFATVEGYLYKVELEIQCEDGDRTKFKSGKIKVKRIL